MPLLDPHKHTTPLNFFLTVNRSVMKWLVINVILYPLGSLSVLLAMYSLSHVIDLVTSWSMDSARPYLIYLIIGIIFYEIFYRLGHICEVIIISRVRNNTKKALFKHTSSLSFGYFADRFAGEIAHKVSTTADAFERMTICVTNHFIEDGAIFIFSFIALSSLHSEYAIFITVWWTLFIAISYFMAQELQRRASIYTTIETKTTGVIVDVYSNIPVVKVYGREENLGSAYDQMDDEMRALQSLGKWDILTFHTQGLSIIILTLGILLLTSSLYGRHEITIGGIVFVATIVLRLYNFIWDMGKNIAEFIRYRGEAIQNLSDLVAVQSVIDGDHVIDHEKKLVKLEYRNITFGYTQNTPILQDFSLIVQPGEKLGIVGLSGAGKTTFANLLLRFFDPQSGGIFLNSRDISEMTQESLRSHISSISQDTSLFHATIAENIAYGSLAASEEEIRHAAHLAYAADFIETLPYGYESVVWEKGIKLSGGQRQRIAIARAILADRPLFLLDEATSALDSESEDTIQKGLVTLMENKTVIAIAHRLSTLSHMDRIVYLENGQILEDGTHEELIALGGKYMQLWNMQAGGFLPGE